MATVPSFRTWVTGEVATAAEMNSNIRDAGNFNIARPLAVLRQTVSQSTSSGFFTAVLLDAEDIDRDGGHSTTTNTSRYTAQTTGWYLIAASGGYNSNATGLRALAVVKNGDQNSLYGRVQVNACSSGSTSLATQVVLYLTAPTDYVEMHMIQTSGAGLGTAIANNESPRLQVFWMST